MMRLLGVLVGSALAVAALVVFVGIPEFTTESNVVETAVITLPIRTDAPPAAPKPVASPQEAELAAAASAPAEEPAPTKRAADTQPAPEPVEAAETPAQPEMTLHWYAFWSPFRSEVAANGFVDQLQRVTGLDYRVVKVKPGVYEVAFAYRDDQDITASLSQISAATGLALPES